MPETAAMDGACATTAGATPARTGGGDYESNRAKIREGAFPHPARSSGEQRVSGLRLLSQAKQIDRARCPRDQQQVGATWQPVRGFRRSHRARRGFHSFHKARGGSRRSHGRGRVAILRHRRSPSGSAIRLLRAAVPFLCVAASTLLHGSSLLLLAALKVVPGEAWRARVSRWLVRVGESWIAVNTRMIAWFTPTKWRIEGLEGLRRDGWYLVVANHQAWADIPVLQAVFNRRVPFLKFFLKKVLRWVPILGPAWWALDFPFMHRHTREQLARRPELAGTDREATRLACQRFARIPTSVMNFLEGTRFTAAKHASTGSPYARLLPARAGGVAFVLDAMGGLLRSVIDVTIAYPAGTPSMLDLFAGRVPEIRVHVRERPIPEDLLQGDYERDPDFRARFQAWVNGLWAEKDATLARLLANA